jgi:hypothetical protein
LRSRALRIGLGVLCVALAGYGCADLVGLDQTYRIDAGDEPGDASVPDGGGDAGPLADSASSADAGTGAGDAAPTLFWVTDTRFGTNGYLTLAAGTPTAPLSATLPILAVDADGGAVLAAYGALGSPMFVCQTTATDASCSQQVPPGAPVDLVSSPVTGHVTLAYNQGVSTELGALSVGGAYPPYGPEAPCVGIRGLSLSSDGRLEMLAACNTTLNVVTLDPSSDASVAPGVVDVANVFLSRATAGLDGDVWLAGYYDDVGVYSHSALDGSVEGNGTVTVGTATYGTDIVPIADGGALLVGYYSGNAAGLFATAVPGNGDGGGLPAPHQFPLTTTTVVAEAVSTPSHTRAAQVGPGVHVVVGASTSPVGLVLVTVDDQGAAVTGSSATPQVLAVDGGSGGVYVGGAVGSLDGTGIYVIVETGDSPSDLVIEITRLVRGTP